LRPALPTVTGGLVIFNLRNGFGGIVEKMEIKKKMLRNI
jgi:hypothetical protein